MTVQESPLLLRCAGETLVGALALPAQPRRVGVVIVVGGPQVRTGSHRGFVELARALAAAGHPVLRFDVRGMGDSTGEPRSFEHIDDDIGAAVDALLAAAPGTEGVVLWGLCDGASAALLYLDATRDARVVGLALANPWLRSEVGLARTRVKHYYRERLLDAAFWRKLLRGGVGLGAVGGLARSVATAWSRSAAAASAAPDFRARMARAWRAFDGPLLLLLSGRDQTAQEFGDALENDPAWRGALARPGVRVQRIADSDHTFSTRQSKAAVETATSAFLDRIAPPQPPAARRAAAFPAA